MAGFRVNAVRPAARSSSINFEFVFHNFWWFRSLCEKSDFGYQRLLAVTIGYRRVTARLPLMDVKGSFGDVSFTTEGTENMKI